MSYDTAVVSLPFSYVEKRPIQRTLNEVTLSCMFEYLHYQKADALFLEVTRNKWRIVEHSNSYDTKNKLYCDAVNLYHETGYTYLMDINKIVEKGRTINSQADVLKLFPAPHDVFSTFARYFNDQYITIYVSIVNIANIGYCYKYIVAATNRSLDAMQVAGLSDYTALCPKVSCFLDKGTINGAVPLSLPPLDRTSDQVAFSVLMSLIHTFDKLTSYKVDRNEDGEPEYIQVTTAGWYIAQWIHDFAMRLAAGGIDVSPLLDGIYIGLGPGPVKLVNVGGPYPNTLVFQLKQYGEPSYTGKIAEYASYYRELNIFLA